MEHLLEVIKQKANILRFGKPHEKDGALGDIYNTLDKLEQQNKWISVEDRLPEFEEDVLCYHGWKSAEGDWVSIKEVGYLTQVNITMAAVGENKTPEFCIDRDYCHDITHWMPLPKDPE